MSISKQEILSAFTSSMVLVQSEFKTFIRNKLKDSNIDLTFEMLQVLRLLWKKEGVNQQELANLLHKDKASLTYLIDNLAKRKLVKRTEDPQDRRNKLITLMPEGAHLNNLIQPWIDEMYSIAGDNIPIQLLEESIALFEKMQINLRSNA